MFDLMFFITAVIANLLIVGIFIFRKKGKTEIERALGYIFLALLIPLAIVFIGYVMEGRELWILIYLIIAFTFWIFELALDYILKIEFRRKPRIHIPYVILYYIAFMGFIAISFVIDVIYGIIVIITYFAGIAALFYLLKGSKNKDAE